MYYTTQPYPYVHIPDLALHKAARIWATFLVTLTPADLPLREWPLRTILRQPPPPPTPSPGGERRQHCRQKMTGLRAVTPLRTLICALSFSAERL